MSRLIKYTMHKMEQDKDIEVNQCFLNLYKEPLILEIKVGLHFLNLYEELLILVKYPMVKTSIEKIYMHLYVKGIVSLLIIKYGNIYYK